MDFDEMSSKAPILLIADVPGWIFERHCRTLQRLLSDEFEITIKYQNEPFREGDYQLIYPLEWYMVEPEDIRQRRKYVTGIRSHLVWTDLEFSEFVKRLNNNFNRVHAVSRRLFDIFSPFIPSLSYITHGVDTDFFCPTLAKKNSDGPLIIGWAGNTKSLGNKGFEDIITPLGKLEGVELIFCGYSNRNLSQSEMRDFYESIDVYVCASEAFEGNNNCLLEAASMAKAIVTTDNGTVPEYLEHGKSALIVSREFQSFRKAICHFRDHRAEIPVFGSRAQQVVRCDWDWRFKAEDYRSFFRVALTGHDQAV